MTEEYEDEEIVMDEGPDPETVMESRNNYHLHLEERMYENWLEGLKDRGGR
jgi:hypothetical protein